MISPLLTPMQPQTVSLSAIAAISKPPSLSGGGASSLRLSERKSVPARVRQIGCERRRLLHQRRHQTESLAVVFGALAHREDVRIGCLQVIADDDPAIHPQTSATRQIHVGPDARRDHYQIRLQLLT